MKDRERRERNERPRHARRLLLPLLAALKSFVALSLARSLRDDLRQKGGYRIPRQTCNRPVSVKLSPFCVDSGVCTVKADEGEMNMHATNCTVPRAQDVAQEME